MITLKHKRQTASAIAASNPVLAAGEFGIETDTGRMKIGDGSTAWNSLAYAFSSAANLTGGTLPDARLSSNIPTLTLLNKFLNFPTAGIDIYPRGECTNVAILQLANIVSFTFFTAPITAIVSSITAATGATAGSGLTLARMGLYTFDETTVTLVARTANDTTLFTAAQTLYTRSFDTAGGYPANYTLTGGSRYGVGILSVGTTLPNYSAKAISVAISNMTPRTCAGLGGQSDLPTTNSNLGNLNAHMFARLT
jgi:hypothetical protein